MANWKDVIELVGVTTTTNAIGDSVETETKTTVFANKMGISQSETYQAMSEGINPSVKFKIRKSDYNGQSRLEYNNKEYKVIRVYDADDEFVELTGEDTVV
jgi:SPP1 family predicted phage head-tail adaptor